MHDTTGPTYILHGTQTAVAPDDGKITIPVDPRTTAVSMDDHEGEPGPRKRPSAKQRAKMAKKRKAAKASRRRNR